MALQATFRWDGNSLPNQALGPKCYLYIQNRHELSFRGDFYIISSAQLGVTDIETSGRTIRLLLVDDHEIVRIGLRTLFTQTEGIDVVAEATTAVDAVEAAVRTKPDVVVMDVRLRDGSGVDACREILARCPDTRVLFLTSYEDEEAMLTAVFAGAQGYLLKEIGSESLLRAVRCVAAGQSILDPAATRTLMDKLQSIVASGITGGADSLSAQEHRVLALVAQGKTNKEIASALDLSDKTVKNYLSNIFQKLRVTRRSEAAAIFSKHLARGHSARAVVSGRRA
jgi:two-component system response regulator DevR